MNEQTIYEGPIFSVVKKEVLIHDRPVVRDLIQHAGGAAICAIDEGKILLVCQYRPGAGCRTLEIPAGMIEKQEDPALSALRELNEETGYEAENPELITAFWPTPGYDNEVIYVYWSNQIHLAEKRLPMDQTEDIEILWMDLSQAWQAVLSGEIRDGKTIIAISYALIRERK